MLWLQKARSILQRRNIVPILDLLKVISAGRLTMVDDGLEFLLQFDMVS